MKATKKLTILVDAALHQQLTELAQREYRSLQGQVVYMLEQTLHKHYGPASDHPVNVDKSSSAPQQPNIAVRG